MTEKTKYIDYLTEDDPIPGQLWVCMSFLSPEGIKNCTIRGLKIRGIYGTRQEADKRAEALQSKDPDFHVFVGEVGKWLPWDPDPNDVSDQVYKEKELNDLMKGYKENLDKAKKMQEQRKQDMIQQAAKEEQSREDKVKTRLRNKLEKKKQMNKMNSLVNKQQSHIEESDDSIDGEEQDEKNIVHTEKEKELHKIEEDLKQKDTMARDEKSRLDSTQKQIDETSKNLETIDSKLAKIQELYNKLHKKA